MCIIELEFIISIALVLGSSKNVPLIKLKLLLTIDNKIVELIILVKLKLEKFIIELIKLKQLLYNTFNTLKLVIFALLAIFPLNLYKVEYEILVSDILIKSTYVY